MTITSIRVLLFVFCASMSSADFYLKAIRNARTIKEAGALKGWLAQVLRGTLTGYYRGVGVRKAALERLSVEREEGQPVLIDDEAKRAVCSCLYRILPTMPAWF